MNWNPEEPDGGAGGGLPFGAAMAFETALLFVAFGWGWLFGQSVLADLRWDFQEFVTGAVAAVLPLAFFLWTLRSKLGLFARHRELMRALVDRVFGKWSMLQLALISACAGFCEEALFRGAIQASLEERAGPTLSLLLASLLFGTAHLLTWTYALLATLIGLYLGWLFIWTDGLLAPMTAHFIYDFVALIWLVWARRKAVARR